VGQRGGDQRSASGGGLPLPELSARGGRLRVYEIPSLHPSTLSGAGAVLGVSSAMPAVLVTTIVLGMLAFPYVVSSQPSVSSVPDKRVIVVPLARAACLCQNPSA
jgi:hypothetical protein